EERRAGRGARNDDVVEDAGETRMRHDTGPFMITMSGFTTHTALPALAGPPDRVEPDDALAQRVRPAGPPTVAESFVRLLSALGVATAFGVAGDANAALADALAVSSIDVLHFGHETGAAFAAVEAYHASDRPAAVFVT